MLWSQQWSPGSSLVVIPAGWIDTKTLNTLFRMETGFQKCWSILSMVTDGNWPFYWSVPAALLARFLGDALGEALSGRQDCKDQTFALLRLHGEWQWYEQIITSQTIAVFSYSKNKHTHDIEGLLRNPADVHIIHPAGALLYFHRESLFLQNTGRKTTFKLVEQRQLRIPPSKNMEM